MKAVVFERYGPPDVLRVADLPKPAPADDQVLVRVHASTVNRTDCGLRSAEFFVSRFITGLLKPRRGRVGMEFAGVVESVGRGVTEFAAGDRVFGIRSGANADYVCAREGAVIAHIPADTSFEEAAAVPDGAITALGALRKAGVREGTRLLVYGASGSIGTAAVQLARHLGAHVTAVCGSPNVELVRSLGADEVIDYLRENFTRNGETYDVVFDAVGKHSFRRSRRSLSAGGVYIGTDPGVAWHMPLLALATRWIGARKVKLVVARFAKDDLLYVARLLEQGAYRPVIERTYPLEQVVEAHRYVDTGQKTGNVVLAVA